MAAGSQGGGHFPFSFALLTQPHSCTYLTPATPDLQPSQEKVPAIPLAKQQKRRRAFFIPQMPSEQACQPSSSAPAEVGGSSPQQPCQWTILWQGANENHLQVPRAQKIPQIFTPARLPGPPPAARRAAGSSGRKPPRRDAVPLPGACSWCSPGAAAAPPREHFAAFLPPHRIPCQTWSKVFLRRFFFSFLTNFSLEEYLLTV